MARTVTCIVAAAVSTLSAPAAVHAQETVAFPFYRAEHALRGLYAHHAAPRWQSFGREATALTQAARQHCAGRLPATGLHAAWSRARLAWMAASSPAVGPVVSRRSQRTIDFWPVRPALLQRALSSQPQSLAQMERVGGPAKGFPAMERLLAEAPSPTHCPYLVLIAEGIEVEADALSSAFAERSTQGWADDAETTRSAFAGWINQWLGGLENLRWQQIEQPIQKVRTSGTGQAPVFARKAMEDNLADWRAQWASLRAQASLTPELRNAPPTPGQALIPIEALLLGKGHIALAERWSRSIDAADAAVAALPAAPSTRQLLALSESLKSITALYQGEVAAALEVAIGFSSADGD